MTTLYAGEQFLIECMNHSQTERLLDVQQNIISMIALGRSMEDCLSRIASEIESLIAVPDAYCSILLLDGPRLKFGAAPSLPSDYNEAIDGIEIGPNVGSCGSAAYKGRTVISDNIDKDPSWQDYLEHTRAARLHACWSVPIISSYEKVIGTFGLYFGHPREADNDSLKLLKRFSVLAGLVIEREQNESKSKALHQALQHNNHRFESFAHAMPDLVLVLDEFGHYVDIFGSEMNSLILPVNLLKGRNLAEVLPPAKSAAMMNVVRECLLKQTRQVFEYDLDVQSGRRVFEARVSPVKHYSPEDPSLGHVIWVARDISERKRADDTIRKLSFYDTVTSLPNRRLLKERLAMQVRKCHEKKRFGAILYVDIDDFKRINDVVGISGGDAMIIEVARRIADELELRDSLARVGGDDFVILLDELHKDVESFSSEVTAVATRILQIFDERFKVADKWFRITGRIGISIFGFEQLAPEKIINQAEAAMYRAKAEHQRVLFFDKGIQQQLTERIHMEYDLEKALSNGEISVYYQPQVATDGEVHGFEALMRWIHPKKGFVSPLEFIPLAESLGIISLMQDVVLQQVCSTIKMLESENKISTDFRIAVNISAMQFTKDDFENTLLEILNAYDVSPERITLEITESTLLEDIEAATSQMTRLRSIGFELSIDDFGTGYSSLAYLQKLPADEIKIDKSFVDAIEDSEAGHNIVAAIVYLARQLKCRVVAEGVEEITQLDLLKALSVDLIQGYYIGKPMALDQLLGWMNQLDEDSKTVISAKSA